MSGTLGIAIQPLRVADSNAEAVRLTEYWSARCEGRAMPARRDLDVVEMRDWLGRLSLYEVLGDGDMWCRLRGSTMCTIPVPGHDSDGVLVSRTQPHSFAEMGLRHYAETHALAEPTCYRIELSFDGLTYRYDRLALPLASDGVLRPMVMTFIKCDVRRARAFWERYQEAGLALTS
ncbi:MAG: PAS domain-containing protein [Proteobacteria bacterium]|nr:PAS domain-containing protein [Pseudomonadota bacterium]MBI3498862.1 PAS domain-containing protein [Pseudomonadota bacterium]